MEKVTLKIDLEEQNLKLELKVNRKLIDSFETPINRDLDQQLIEGLDKLFKRNRLSRLSLETVETGRNIDKNSTYHRIIIAFKKGLLSTK